MTASRRAVRKAKRTYELARLRALMEENQREVERLNAIRNRPCPACVERGWLADSLAAGGS